MRKPRAGTVVNVALALVFVWPLVQMALVRIYDVNPWKLAGWGMYSTPELVPEVSIACRTPDEVGRYELGTVQPEWAGELDAFILRRRGLGRLARPDTLGRKLLEVYPAILGVEITVEQPVLDPRTGMIESRTTVYSHDRQGT
jgi:hypothetical protein